VGALYRRLEKPLYNLPYRYVWTARKRRTSLHDAFMELLALAIARRQDGRSIAWLTVLNALQEASSRSRTKHFLRGDDSLGLLPATQRHKPTPPVSKSMPSCTLRSSVCRIHLLSVLLLVEFSELSYDVPSRNCCHSSGHSGLTAEFSAKHSSEFKSE